MARDVIFPLSAFSPFHYWQSLLIPRSLIFINYIDGREVSYFDALSHPDMINARIDFYHSDKPQEAGSVEIPILNATKWQLKKSLIN
jgi:hypothetical protein